MPALADGHYYSLPPGQLEQSVTLGELRFTLHMASDVWELLVLILLLGTGAASRVSRRIRCLAKQSWLRSALFSCFLVALLFLAVDMPVSAIGHAVSLHYRISVESWQPWLEDKAKEFLLTLLLESALLTLLFGLLRGNWSRRHYWLWFAAFLAPLSVLITLILPAVIEPLFNSFSPLADTHPALVADLQRVVTRTGTDIPTERMFLMKASEKSNGLNAYVTGFGPSKRIVVWDTTADRMREDEILFTFAHETGHYVLNHIAKGLAVGAAGIFLLFAAVAWLSNRLIRRYGRAWKIRSVATLPGLAVLLLSFTLLQDISEPLANFASRFIEHEADIYGQEAVHGIVGDPQAAAIGAFNALGAAYLDEPDPNPVVVLLTYDHPSIQSRATFAAHYNPWTAGAKPRFFAK
jgi:Zn-dependent protease with chaperone function